MESGSASQDGSDSVPALRSPVPETELREALNVIVRDALRPVASGLATLYAVFAISHLFVLRPPLRLPMALLALASSVGLIAARLALRRVTVPPRWVHPVLAAFISVTVVNSLVHLYLTHEPRQTTNLMLLIIGAGCVFLSLPWLALIAGASVLGWAAIVWTEPSRSQWIHFGFALFTATVLSVVVHIVRERAYRRLVTLRWRDHQQRVELEEALLALRQSEERFQRLADATFEGIIVHDDGTLLDANQTLAVMFGYQRSEVLSMKVSDFVTPECHEVMSEGGGKDGDVPREAIGVGKDGTTFPIEVRSRMMPYRGRTVRITALRDVTERKRAEEARLRAALAEAARRELEADITLRQRREEEIRRLNAQLEARVGERTAQLTAANNELEAFSYSVSHDLRTPLRGINGFSQALMEEYGDRLDSQGQLYLERVQAATRRMGELIDDLLALSRVTRTELRYEVVDLSGMAKSVAEELSKSSPERKVTFDIQPGVTANGDARLLRVVLENLLGNAWKFTAKRPSAHIEFGVRNRPGERAYFVRDNGAGFDMAYADKLFGAFQRLHAATEFEGTGVGLATVRRVIQRHGGRVWGEAAVDRGATFWFAL